MSSDTEPVRTAAEPSPAAEEQETKRPATDEDAKKAEGDLKHLHAIAKSFAEFVDSSLSVLEQPDPTIKGSKPLTGNPLKRSMLTRKYFSHITFRLTMLEACMLQGRVMAPPGYPEKDVPQREK